MSYSKINQEYEAYLQQCKQTGEEPLPLNEWLEISYADQLEEN